MKRNRSSMLALAAALSLGCAGDDANPVETMDDGAVGGGDAAETGDGDGGPGEAGSEDDAGGSEDGGTDDDGGDNGDDSSDDGGSTARCEAVCAGSAECGYETEACLSDCADTVSDLSEACAAAYEAWSVCDSAGGCDGEADCTAEHDTMSTVCEPTDEITSACASFCATATECAPEEYGDFGVCIIDCELDGVLAAPNCAVADLALLECYGALTCGEWSSVATEESPCAAQELAWEEVCF
ncbi:MAG: hypothetical protein AAF721_17425 [Myxococcota bacterium]